MAAKRSTAKQHIHYHRDGSIWAKGQLLEGVATGYWEWFRKDGTRMRSGYFEHGRQVGEWTTYDRDGRVVKVTTMKPRPTSPRRGAGSRTRQAAAAHGKPAGTRAPRAPKHRPQASRGVIDGYLASLPQVQRVALERLRKAIRAAAPRAEECLSYSLPAFRLDGKVLVGFGASARHCAFYPMSGTTVSDHQKLLAGYETSKGAIRFSPEKPLPATLVRKLVKARVAEIGARSGARQRRGSGTGQRRGSGTGQRRGSGTGQRRASGASASPNARRLNGRR